MKKGKLHRQTLALLAKRPPAMQYARIGKATKLPEQWLANFATGRLKSPDVSRVEKLYEFLSKTKLNIA